MKTITVDDTFNSKTRCFDTCTSNERLALDRYYTSRAKKELFKCWSRDIRGRSIFWLSTFPNGETNESLTKRFLNEVPF